MTDGGKGENHSLRGLLPVSYCFFYERIIKEKILIIVVIGVWGKREIGCKYPTKSIVYLSTRKLLLFCPIFFRFLLKF